jgi:hypothetical protein
VKVKTHIANFFQQIGKTGSATHKSAKQHIRPPISNVTAGAKVHALRAGKDKYTHLREMPDDDRKFCCKTKVNDGDIVTIMEPPSSFPSTECCHRANHFYWYWVRTPDNAIGWIKSDHLEKRLLSHGNHAHGHQIIGLHPHAVGAPGIQFTGLHPHAVGVHGHQIVMFHPAFGAAFHGFTH